MKPIKITLSSADLIDAALASVNGASYAHAFTTYRCVKRIREVAEKLLTSLVYKKDSAGAKFCATSGDSVANAYKYSRRATRITITRKSSEWYLTSIESIAIFKDSPRDTMTLTTDQDAAAKRILSAQYSVA